MENIDPNQHDFKPSKRKGKCPPSKRFKPATCDEEVDKLTEGYTPDNTLKSTTWAVKVFNDWRCSREEKCPPNILTNGNVDDLNYWLPRFVNEVRKSDGCAYLHRSIHQLLSGLQRYMLGQNHLLPKFMDRHNPVFRPIHNVCDSVFRELHCSGIGTSVRHTGLITEDEESKLCDYGILGIHNPKSLQRAVFFYIGKRCCVRGGDEQRLLGPSQFIRSVNPDCITYVECGSKNNSGRVKDFKYENKEVMCPALPDERPRCLVYLLDLYLTKLPKFASNKNVLYLRPKRTIPHDPDTAWYENVPVG